MSSGMASIEGYAHREVEPELALIKGVLQTKNYDDSNLAMTAALNSR
jgi:hypothetical protein